MASNPTWIKNPKSYKRRVRPSMFDITRLFLSHVERMESEIDISKKNVHAVPPCIDCASSKSLPLKNNSIDLVITSPPYCTRIDYAISSKPEYAILGYPVDARFKTIRNHFIGTTTVRGDIPKPNTMWGAACLHFLSDVEKHSSKGSHNYYHKLFCMYFDDLWLSLCEINRTLAEEGECVLVIQDSWYKDVFNNTPLYIMEMASNFNWKLCVKNDFHPHASFSQLHPHRNKYTKGSTKPTESVLWFSKRQ